MIRLFGIWMLLTCFFWKASGDEVIRINQMGYLPNGLKVAVFLSNQNVLLKKFKVVDNLTDRVIFEGVPSSANGTMWGQKSAYRLDFSSVVQPGGYHLEASSAKSPSFAV